MVSPSLRYQYFTLPVDITNGDLLIKITKNVPTFASRPSNRKSGSIPVPPQKRNLYELLAVMDLMMAIGQ